MRTKLVSFPRRLPGAAMVEFVLLLPIIILVTGLSMYLAMGLSTKEDLVIHTRYQAWRDLQTDFFNVQVLQNGNVNVSRWTWQDDMSDKSWSPYDLTANGSPGSGCGTQSQPRGTGDALDYALTNAGQEADSMTNNTAAQQLFNLTWNNLPGRYDIQNSVLYTTSGTGFDKILKGTIYSELQIDTADWTHGQLPLWVIANGQDGPMYQINQIFNNTFGASAANLPEPFQRMGQEVLHGWFTESYMMSWNNAGMKVP